MTPPEDKAKELVQSFRPYVWQRIHIRSEGQEKEYAKACAIICCNEVLHTLSNAATSTEPYTYWQQVKSSIEQL